MLMLAWFLLVAVLSVSVFSMETSIVKGTISNGDVFHDFGKTILKVSPERARSISDVFAQTVTITNKAGEDLYYFLNDYSENITQTEISLIENVDKVVPNFVTRCEETLNNSKTETVCSEVENGTKTIQESNLKKLNSNVSSWGNTKHTFTTTGTLIKNGETKQFYIKYHTSTENGKFDVRIWANNVNDWECILDDNKNCKFSYDLDPTWTRGVTDLIYYWMLNDDNLTDVVNNKVLQRSGCINVTGILNSGQNCSGASGAGLINSTLSIIVKSISIWTNMPANNGKYLYYGNPTSTGNIGINNVNATHNRFTCRLGNGASYTGTNCSFSINTWHHIACVNNGSAVKLYIDSVICNTTNGAANTQTDTGAAFMRHYNLVNYEPAGFIDEIGMWNASLEDWEIQSLYNNGSALGYPFINTTDNYNFSTNMTYASPVFETNNTNVAINFSYGDNITNVYNVTLNGDYFDTPSQVLSLTSNGTCGVNCTWEYYSTSIRPKLVASNPTLTYYNYTYNTNLSNGTTWSNATANQTMNVYYSFVPQNVWIETQAIETHNTTWNATYNTTGANFSDVTITYISQYNYTNTTGTHLNNGTNNVNASFSFRIPFLNDTDYNRQFNITPFINVTFNGTTVSRNGSAGASVLYGSQGVYKMLLTNCSNGSITVSTTHQYYIRNIVSDALLNADSAFNYSVWLPENYNDVTYVRNYNFSFLTNSSPRICIYPNSTTFTYGNVNYSADINYTANLTGYTSASGELTEFNLSNVSSTTTIYLTNTTAVQEIIVTITDQNDNKLINYTVRAYLYQNGSYTLMDSEVTNLQGQVRYNLYVYDKLYQFRVYYPNGTLAKSAPETEGSTIISTSFTIKVDLVPDVTIGNVLEMLGINHTLTFTEATGIVNLTFNDSDNLTSYNCLRIINWTNGTGTIIGNNCTTNHSGTLLYSLGTSNGSFVAAYIATRDEDGLNYLIDSISITRVAFQDLEEEGIFWAFLLIGTITAIGLYINPVLGIVFLEFGIIACYWLGIISGIGWGALASIIAGGLFVAFLLGKEQ